MSNGALVLLIEDDPDAASSMRIILEAENLKITVMDNPEDGFKEAKKIKPDLIILDVMFGEREESRGFYYAQKMKRDKDLAPIPILMVTAVNIRHKDFSFSPRTDGEYLPVDDFIDKPAQPEDLVRKVKKLLDQKVSKWKDWPNPTP